MYTCTHTLKEELSELHNNQSDPECCSHEWRMWGVSDCDSWLFIAEPPPHHLTLGLAVSAVLVVLLPSAYETGWPGAAHSASGPSPSLSGGHVCGQGSSDGHGVSTLSSSPSGKSAPGRVQNGTCGTHVTEAVRASDPPIATDDIFGWQDTVGKPAQPAQLPECQEVSFTQRTGTAVKTNDNEVPSSSVTSDSSRSSQYLGSFCRGTPGDSSRRTSVPRHTG